MICPNCHHVSNDYDPDVMPGVCPACGIAIDKWLKAQGRDKEIPLYDPSPPDVHVPIDAPAAPEPAVPEADSLGKRLFYYTCFMPSDRDVSAFWGHIVLWLLFAVWGAWFIFTGIDWVALYGSFLHQVDLPFHEYGHIAFSPFGEFMTVLGGSLFQVMVPLFPLAYFMIVQRDNFAAALMLWWCGQNFIDVAPYIADAQLRAIPLTTGEPDTHDWWQLLSMSDALDSAGFLAQLCYLVGAGIIVLSLVWGGFLLWVEFRGRTEIVEPLVEDEAE